MDTLLEGTQVLSHHSRTLPSKLGFSQMHKNFPGARPGTEFCNQGLSSEEQGLSLGKLSGQVNGGPLEARAERE